jgi:glycosyltransferase involved in cell wall biosynthesis
MRLAFLSPLPPSPTGIADYSREVLTLLADTHAIDAFHDQAQVDALPGGCTVRHVRELTADSYDLAIHQLGNGTAHGFQYEPLVRMPGLLVLHDLVLHHSRARMFLDAPEVHAYARDPSSAAARDAAQAPIARYRAEVAYAYPSAAERLVDAQLATIGDLLPYAYPLFRLPVEASRLIAVHNEYMAAAIRAEIKGARVVRIPMPAERVNVARDAVAAVRARHGIRHTEVVVASFGLLTREKRLETVARAFARVAATVPGLRLLLVGAVPDPDPLLALLERLGIRERVILAGRVAFSELPAYMEAADIVVHLRYPTARETSAALLRVLAQGRPTLLADLEHLSDIPDAAVVRVDPADEEGGVARGLLRLAQAPAERARLAHTAAAFVRREHAPERSRAGYEAAITEAVRLPAASPRAEWPAHWRV